MCVTGLVVVDTGTHWSRFGQAVILVLIQLGGLGLMTYASVFALLVWRGMRIREVLAMREVFTHDLRAEISRLAKFILLTTLGIEAAGAGLLYGLWDHTAGGGPVDWGDRLFYSVFHSISAFCNAGFCLYADSLMSYRSTWQVNVVFPLLIILGGLGFAVLYNFARLLRYRVLGRGRAPLLKRRMTLQAKLAVTTTLVLLVGGTAAALVLETFPGRPDAWRRTALGPEEVAAAAAGAARGPGGAAGRVGAASAPGAGAAGGAPTVGAAGMGGAPRGVAAGPEGASAGGAAEPHEAAGPEDAARPEDAAVVRSGASCGSPLGRGWAERLAGAWFLATTARTAGFNTSDTTCLAPPTKFLTVLLMFIGASPGSTGGGIKTVTVAVVLCGVWAAIRGRPHVQVFRRRIPGETVRRALAILAVGVGWIAAMTTVVAAWGVRPGAEFTFLDALFETQSAFATVGLSTGMTPLLNTLGRLLMILTMFVGRVGLLMLFVAMQFKPQPERWQYPHEGVAIS